MNIKRTTYRDLPTNHSGTIQARLGTLIVLTSVIVNTADSSATTNGVDRWDTTHHHYSFFENRNTPDPFRDHYRQLIGTGYYQAFSTQRAINMLDRNRGQQLSTAQRDRYVNSIRALEGIEYSDMLAQYSVSNNVVDTYIALKKDLTLYLTFFADREEDIIAFSLDYKDDNIVAGRGSSAEIAQSVFRFLEKFDPALMS